MRKDINGYKYYYITDTGEIYSKNRQVEILNPNTKQLMTFTKKGRKLAKKINNSGYYEVCLFENNTKKYYLVHRLVAQTFIPNPNNLPQVNHKDEDKLNNSIDNLEWCTSTYNHSYGTGNIRRKVNQKAKAVVQYTTNNSYINSFFSIKEAERVTGIKSYNISAVCKNKRKTAGGYIWSYEKLDKQES
jgi:hypothetical protein